MKDDIKNRFLKSIKNGVLVCDGAMGTMLYEKGIYLNKCFDELNLTNPSMVEGIHCDYVKSGADIIETNTFGANRFRLLTFGLEKKIRQINIKGAEIARKSSGKNCYIAGSIGPINAHLKPIGGVSRDELMDIYREQVSYLLEGGVDILMFETFPGIEMLKYAVKAARELTDIPIVGQITFNDFGRTLHEESPEAVSKNLDSCGIDVLGANCSVGPSVMLESLIKMREHTDIPLAAQPNAGLPKIVDGRFIYLCSPEYMAEYTKRFIQNGVNLIGGCCGTTPDHIKAMVGAVKAVSPGRITSKKKEIVSIQEDSSQIVEIPDKEKSKFAYKIIKGQFVKCIEIDPPKGASSDDVIKWVSRLAQNGVDAVNIADGPRATARMSPIALASIIGRASEIDVILHFCCRDRNMLGMQSDLLGAGALGIKNILAVTGDPPKLGDYPDATAVFDVDSIGLLKIASNLNHARDIAGNDIKIPTTFYLGVGLNPGAINLDDEIRRFELKVEQGAKFAMTQPVFDVTLLKNALKRIEKFNIPVLAGILPLYNLKNAEFLSNEVPGMQVPEKILKRMRENPTGDNARLEGIRIAQEALNECKSMVQGVYIMPPFGRYELALNVLEGI